MKFTRLMATAALAAGLAGSAGLAAADAIDGGGHHGGMELLQGLNLTDAQQTQIQQIVKSARAQSKPTQEQMHGLHDQLAAALLSGATMDQLAPVVRQEEALRNRFDTQRLSVALQIRSLLTPEQLSQAGAEHAKLAALHQQEREIIGGQQTAQ